MRTDAEYAERVQKRGLWSARSGLAEDLKMQRAAARVIKAENRRLAEEMGALDRSVRAGGSITVYNLCKCFFGPF